MAFPPTAHPLNVIRPAKVAAILRLLEPAGARRGLAGLTAGRFGAVALGAAIVGARNKELPAMEALA